SLCGWRGPPRVTGRRTRAQSPERRGAHRRTYTPSRVETHSPGVDRNFKRHFCGKAVRTAGFLPVFRSIFCLYTVHLSSIVGGNSWHFHHFPAVRGGSYGASRGHLCTPGSQPDGALPRDHGAPRRVASVHRNLLSTEMTSALDTLGSR